MVLTPFTLSGAMAPVTIAGALALQNAEALAGLCFIQMINPGVPCVYGGFTSNVDMKTRRAGLRHAGIHPRRDGRRPAGAALQAAVPLQQRLRRQRGRCPGGL